MKNIPSICIDNFYSEPHKVREWALQQEFAREEGGAWPGKRTRPIDVIDPDFYQNFTNKIFSIVMDIEDNNINAKIDSTFQLIPNLSEDETSPKNKGWIHQDDGVIFAGIIFLNPEIDPNCGTSLFKLNDETKMDWSSSKQDFLLKGIDNNYDSAITGHNSAFEETVRFQNVFNRCIIFDSEVFHGVNSFYNNGADRLTQVFFVHSADITTPPPIARHKRFL